MIQPEQLKNDTLFARIFAKSLVVLVFLVPADLQVLFRGVGKGFQIQFLS